MRPGGAECPTDIRLAPTEQRPQIKQYSSVKTLRALLSNSHSLFEKSEAKTLSFANAIITRRVYYENI